MIKSVMNLIQIYIIVYKFSSQDKKSLYIYIYIKVALPPRHDPYLHRSILMMQV